MDEIGIKKSGLSVVAVYSQWQANAEAVRRRASGEAEKKPEAEPIPTIESLSREHVCQSALSLDGGVVKNWSKEDVEAWLKKENCQADPEAFRKQGVDGATLLEITDSDLMLMGMTTMQDRKYLLRCLKKLAYYELYPKIVDDNDQATTEDVGKSDEKFCPPVTDYNRAMEKKVGYLFASLVVMWEIIMNFMVFHPLLHLISLFPLALTSIQAIGWWYRVWLKCAEEGRRNTVADWESAKKYLKNPRDCQEEGKDLEDKIYLYSVSHAVFSVVAPVLFVLLLIPLILTPILTAPPSDRGTAEICKKVAQCNGRGTCDSTGECWCTLGFYTGDSCESVSGVAIALIVIVAWLLFAFQQFARKWIYFRREVKVLKQMLKERMEDEQKMMKEDV